MRPILSTIAAGILLSASSFASDAQARFEQKYGRTVAAQSSDCCHRENDCCKKDNGCCHKAKAEAESEAGSNCCPHSKG